MSSLKSFDAPFAQNGLLPPEGRSHTNSPFGGAGSGDSLPSSSSPPHSSPASHNDTMLHAEPLSRDSGQAGPSRQASSATNTSGTTSRPPRRRIRPKIALDPSQPPTAQGKPRARVYVACNQCRVRKTRCDGAKPVCFHCRKRPPEDGEQCNYEPQPKRRGQDKAPGARVRKASKRRRVSAGDSDNSDSDGSCCDHGSSDSTEPSDSLNLHASYENLSEMPSDDSPSEYDPFPADLTTLIERPSSSVETDVRLFANDSQDIPARPGLQFTRETWWDALLTFYGSEYDGIPADVVSLTTEQRSTTTRRIVMDLRALFQSSIYWLGFIHLPRFFDTVLNPTRRAEVQPSLLLSALAVGTLAQSSEAERGAPGRARASRLRDMADSALQASLASGWVDVGLIQASWFIAYFEMQSDPLQTVDRNHSSLVLLDSLMRLFSLTTLDADLKNTRAVPQTSHIYQPSCFAPMPSADDFLHATTSAPTGSSFSPLDWLSSSPAQNPTFAALPSSLPNAQVIPPPLAYIPDHMTLGPSTSPSPPRCNCAQFTLQNNWPSVQGFAPSLAGTVMWPTGVSEGELRKEESRRLVWSTVIMTASLNSYTSARKDVGRQRLSIKDPRNYALLFPGESLALSGSPVQANNVWTLYLRSMLLMHACMRTRGDASLSEAERAQFAMSAWLEIDSIEHALEQHTCGLERTFGFQAREMLFSSRMCVSHEFQRYIPQVTTHGSQLFYRDKAEGWLRHRMEAAERVWQSLLDGERGHVLDFRKPLLIFWFMSHVVKALVLWRTDPTLVIALAAAKSFVKRAEYLMMFWPSAEQRREWAGVRYQLVEACLQAGIPPPDPCIPVPFPRKRT
ncbi:hypothetical protein C8Q79DRAFT_201865 [Trametes meyenii]|nr:hypothetical protein C8Q79DRAFT_201865 [Trametes meyenii]